MLSLVLTVLVTSANAAVPPSAVCRSTKVKTTAKAAAALLGCHAQAAKKGRGVAAACVTKTTGKLFAAFTKADGKGGCEARRDAPAVGAILQRFAGDLSEILRPPGGPSKCAASELASAGTFVRTVLNLYARDARKPDAARLLTAYDAAEAKLVAALAKRGCSLPLRAALAGHAATVAAATGGLVVATTSSAWCCVRDAGGACSSGLRCTVSPTCDAPGFRPYPRPSDCCVFGEPCDDRGECVTTVCEPVSERGACVATPKDAGVSCGDSCDACDGAGACVPADCTTTTTATTTTTTASTAAIPTTSTTTSTTAAPSTTTTTTPTTSTTSTTVVACQQLVDWGCCTGATQFITLAANFHECSVEVNEAQSGPLHVQCGARGGTWTDGRCPDPTCGPAGACCIVPPSGATCTLGGSTFGFFGNAVDVQALTTYCTPFGGYVVVGRCPTIECGTALAPSCSGECPPGQTCGDAGGTCACS
jgi:hypothetical protein